MKNRIIQTSVFADAPGGGNPCPVVLDGDELTTEEGMALASRFMAETVLVGKSAHKECEVKYRFFVPRHEMEMCIHATIAATTVLKTLNHITRPSIQVETQLGPIAVEWQNVTNDVVDIVVTVEQFPPTFSQYNPSADEIAKVLRISPSDIVDKRWPIQSVSTSRYKLIVPLRSVEILDSLEPNFEALWALCSRYKTTGVYVFAPLSIQHLAQTYSSRQFPNKAGYNEDPATGVAACALGSYLANYGDSSEGWNSYCIVQGRAMKKPSRIDVRAYVAQGAIERTQVSGKAYIEETVRDARPLC